ncbi:hypothetical protein [Shimia ponticola]|uniref:hypothetical protein n=1 Tax=Shimia ponticola TaxID=2582893 RepID=UPI0011BDA6B2|nr:hypothetical protein [Shimia ponticola]
MATLRPLLRRPITIALLIAAVFGLFAAASADAHVRWFVGSVATVDTFEPYQITDFEVLAWIAAAVGLISASVFLDMRLPEVRIVDTKTRHDFIEILRVFTGMSMMLTAYEGAVIAPHLVAFDGFGTVLLFLQAVIGILLIANRFVRHAAILMIILHLGLAVKFGILAAAEYLIMVAIAVFLLINNLPTEELRNRFKPYSVDLLRIITGISLITLGFSEKLFGAMMAEHFLVLYPWNFMATLGLDFFTDRLFVLSAGVMEVVFGIILVLGTTTRLNVLAFSVVLFASNVLFLIDGNNEAAMVEFIGHMPVIGVALILLLLGAGQRLKITNFLPDRNVNTSVRTVTVPDDA